MLQSMQDLPPPSARGKESKDGVSKDSTLPPELANAVKALKFITEQDKKVQDRDKGHTGTSKPQRATKSYASQHAVPSRPKIMSKSDSTTQQREKTDPTQSSAAGPHTISLTVQELFQSSSGQKDTSGTSGLMNKDDYLTESLKRDLGMSVAQKRYHQQAPPHGHAPRGPS